MTWRYTKSQATKDTAESLLKKLRPFSDRECMDVIQEVQTNYHLPDKARTIGEMLAEARQQSGAAKLAGHDIMALERFDPDTRHMIVFDVLSHESPVGWKGEKMRLFLTEAGYGKALENQDKGFIKIRNHAKVLAGDLHFIHKVGPPAADSAAGNIVVILLDEGKLVINDLCGQLAHILGVGHVLDKGHRVPAAHDKLHTDPVAVCALLQGFVIDTDTKSVNLWLKTLDKCKHHW